MNGWTLWANVTTDLETLPKPSEADCFADEDRCEEARERVFAFRPGSTCSDHERLHVLRVSTEGENSERDHRNFRRPWHRSGRLEPRIHPKEFCDMLYQL